MRRIVLAVMSTAAAVIMLFGYRTSTPHPDIAAPTSITAGSGTSTGTPATPPAPVSGTIVGDTVSTHWGPVQVQITVDAGEVTAVELLEVPSGNGRDVEINNRAVPILIEETLQAQSADIDSVSGATVTSDGYVASLQSALDEAGL